MPQSKRTTSGMGSICKITRTINGKNYTYYEARYTAGFDPGTGKQIQRSITDKSKKVVAQKLKAAMAAIDAGTYKAPCKMTVAQWLDIWVAEYLNSVKPLTKHNYNKQVQKHFKPALGAVRLDALDTHTIQRFYNSLSASGLSPKTVKNLHGILHCALQQAIACDYLSRNPADACKLPKVTNPEIKPLEPVEIARLLKEAEQDDYCNLFIVAMFTGMRQGELLGLAWECVDFQTGIITVKQQLQCKDGNYFLETPKSGKNRTILPAPIVIDALRNQLERQQKEREQAGKMWDNQFNLVFTDALGKYLVRRTVVKHFKKISGCAGISDDARFQIGRASCRERV